MTNEPNTKNTTERDLMAEIVDSYTFPIPCNYY